MLDADKLFDVFCYDDKQRKQCEIQYGLKMTSEDHAFFKLKKQNTRVNVWQQPWREIIRTLKNASTIQRFMSNIRLRFFYCWHAVLEITKIMPSSTVPVYTVSAIQYTIISNCS